LKIKHLLDVCKALKIKEFKRCVVLIIVNFLQIGTKLQNYSKATPKTTPKHRTVENQALDEIFWSFGVCSKKVSPNPPDPLGTIFAGKTLVFSIHFSITPKTPKKSTKSLKIKGLMLWSFLWSGFGVALEFLAPLQKTSYNKAPPRPTRCLAPP
jgi:hypothetical protein